MLSLDFDFQAFPLARLKFGKHADEDAVELISSSDSFRRFFATRSILLGSVLGRRIGQRMFRVVTASPLKSYRTGSRVAYFAYLS